MKLTQIAIFIIMCCMGTFCMVKGCLKYLSQNPPKKRTAIITSIQVAIINLAGCGLMTYVEFMK